jgi:hypothetical protein
MKLIIFIIFGIFGNQSEPINKVSLMYKGGENNFYERLDITKDSIIYNSKLQNKNIFSFKEKTNAVFWDSIIRVINIENFDRIKPRPHSNDFPSRIMIIETEKSTHKVFGGNKEPLINEFNSILNRKIEQIRDKRK